MMKYSSEMIDGAIRSCKAAGWTELLDISCMSISDSDLRLLSQERGVHLLTGLQIRHADNVSDAGLQHIALLRGLRRLGLTHPTINGDGLRYLSALPRLTSMLLYSDYVSDEGMRHIASIATLEQLGLGGFRMNGATCRHLSRLESLSELSLGGMCTVIRDEDFEWVGTLIGLRRLSINEGEIFGHGLKHLGELKLLESITFDHCALLGNVSGLGALLPPRGSLRKLVVKECPVINLRGNWSQETDARQLLNPIAVVESAEVEPARPKVEDATPFQEWQKIPEDDRRLCLAMLEIVAESPARMDKVIKELKNPARAFQCHFHRSRIYERMTRLIASQFVLRKSAIHEITPRGKMILSARLGVS